MNVPQTGNVTLPGGRINDTKTALTLFNNYGQLYLRDVVAATVPTDATEAQQKFYAAITADSNGLEAKIHAFAESNKANTDVFNAGSYEA